MTIQRTPIFGIKWPDSREKPKDHGTNQEAMALSIEAALLAASIPPTSNPDVRVAPSEAARDAHFGKPATAAAQLALQARGPMVIRTDTGHTERYFAAYNAATNKAGRAVAGWYPAGQMSAQYAVAFSSSGTGVDPIGALTLKPAVSSSRAADLFAPIPAGLTLRNPGVYRFGFDLLASPAKLGTRSFVDLTVGGEAFRFGLAAGAGTEDHGAATTPDVVIATPGPVTFGFYRNVGAAAPITGRIFATYLGPNT
ncbi:hypothetical protein [Plantibacter sp. RU18]|uniref:hypothetical protein n=1 Tax=Plantibacter sp. RU18 TaxID=3158143 RepID=UPI002BB52061|nr:hypothetical protein [Gemmatimonadaceae bacterium]